MTGLAATVDPLREAGVAREILATSTWIEGLPPSDALVSIVLPTHDRPGQLREAIASVLEQDHRNFELLVVDDGTAAPAGSPRAAAEALERDGHDVVWCREAGLTDPGRGGPESTRLADVIRDVRPDLVLTPADPATEAELLRRFTAHVTFAPGASGQRPTGRWNVSLGCWDGQAPFGLRAPHDTALRGALLRALDAMHARWLGVPTPPELPDDAVFPVTDTRGEPGLVTVLRDATVAPATPAGIVVEG